MRMLDQLLKIAVSIFLLIFFIPFTGLASAHSYSPAQNPVTIEVNGKLVPFKNAPFLYQDHTMVPVRELGHHLHAAVQWNGVKKSVTVSNEQKTITLQLHSNRASINKKPIMLPQSVQLIQGVAYAPLRFVAEGLQAEVKWNHADQRVSIQHLKKLTPEQAEEVVRKYLSIPSDSKTMVEYDFDWEEGIYAIHVYNMVEDHTATLGWYLVDASSGSVESMY